MSNYEHVSLLGQVNSMVGEKPAVLKAKLSILLRILTYAVRHVMWVRFFADQKTEHDELATYGDMVSLAKTLR